MARENKEYTCCFFGHRKIAATNELKERLYKIIEDLIINKDVDTFLFGSKSDFDKLCLEIVTSLKIKHPHIQRIYVRAEYQYINNDYKSYLLQRYDDTYYPQQLLNAGRAVYVKRNNIMIDSSEFCIVYYKDGYRPPRRKQRRQNLAEYQPKSGTKIAYEYAQRKQKVIIQAADF